MLGADDVVDKTSKAYIGGEVAETAGEIAAFGGSAALKKAAVKAIERKLLEEGTLKGAKRAICSRSAVAGDSQST